MKWFLGIGLIVGSAMVTGAPALAQDNASRQQTPETAQEFLKVTAEKSQVLYHLGRDQDLRSIKSEPVISFNANDICVTKI